MTRSTPRRAPQMQAEQPGLPTAPATPQDGPGEVGEKGRLSRRWQIVVFLWITAFVALALYELLQAVFRLF